MIMVAIKLDPMIEGGLEAECWDCGEKFIKEHYCKGCGFYLCSHCGFCACDIPEKYRIMLERTVRAMASKCDGCHLTGISQRGGF